MSECAKCGTEVGQAKFCTSCGHAQKPASKPEPQKVAATIAAGKATQPAPASAEGMPAKNKKWLAIGSGIAVVVLIAVAFGTARYWEKTDIPAHPETFHSETYLTGNYEVLDDGWSPCWVGQDWTNCTNMFVAEYNSTCVPFPLTTTAYNYCADYSAMIDDMQARDSYGSYVASLGSWGSLTAVPESATKQVSNKDYRPAVTHRTVCIFGFIGECE